MPKDLPDDPVLLKQLLEQMLSERESDKGKIVHLEEENALLRQRLFGRKSEQTADPATPQMALFNEAESVAELVDEVVEEEVVAPTKRRGKRKPLPADLPRIEVIHELPEHELTCACGCRKHAIGEEISEQLEIGALHRSRLLADRQQRRRACDPALRDRAQELAVQRHAQRRDGQRSTLQPG